MGTVFLFFSVTIVSLLCPRILISIYLALSLCVCVFARVSCSQTL